MFKRALFIVMAIGPGVLACDQNSMTGPMDAGARDVGPADRAAEAVSAAVQEARELADTLELGHQRYFACRGAPNDTNVWEGSDRDCFVAMMARYVERQDTLFTCLREAARAYVQCGAATPCSEQPCADAIFLDDTPLEELASDTCSIPVEARAELTACRRPGQSATTASLP